MLAVLSVSACSKPSSSLSWREVSLPGAVMLRDVADCGDRWWAAGGAGGGPAAWTSVDGVTWSSVPFSPLPASYYGPREVINSVACAGERVAMIGAVPGGAHGNPRVSTWRFAGGRLVENAAPFETYGGDQAVDVGPMAAGPSGFAIAGNRSSGGAAWIAPPSAREFRLIENAPGLAGKTVARDVVALPDGRWLVVGGSGGVLDQRSAAWVSSDGKDWSRDDPPVSGGFNEIQRVVPDGDDLLAAGMRGTAFGLWRWHAGAWTAGPTFGGDASGVRSLALAGGKPVLVGGGLFIDGRSVPAPAPPVAVAGRGATLLLASPDRLWIATV
ncbi:hypothetical protein ACIA5D_46945 [Actinoplanes sp. NPDC051513]|uniref:hypothetical protein n=1 Tax=Actinoplanes sp. NPDC051513 TaxID=3363908 RepID=UPI00379C921E